MRYVFDRLSTRIAPWVLIAAPPQRRADSWRRRQESASGSAAMMFPWPLPRRKSSRWANIRRSSGSYQVRELVPAAHERRITDREEPERPEPRDEEMRPERRGCVGRDAESLAVRLQQM